ncbi:hypothetical protein Q8A73_012026 [Channa argus]|nr:hypothetical protein Q8A73_012026 [Channa argus]
METVFGENRVFPLVAFYLSTLLRLNAFLRLTLSGLRFSQEDVDQRRHSCCPTWPPSRNSVDDVCSPLCWGGETSVERVKFVQSILPAVPTLCRSARSVCATILAVILVAPSVLCVSFRPSVSTVVMVCGGIRSVLFTLLTVTGYCTQLLDLPSL